MIIGREIIRREKVSSTNSVALALMSTRFLKEGTIIVASNQYDGKGQKGNCWESEPGKNLTISIILYPSFILPENQFIISKVISLAIIDTLIPYTSGLSIKWPNDIYVKDDKIAGILIENSLSGNNIESCIAGIGLNVNQTEFKSDAPNPVSLKNITGINHDLNELFSILQLNCEKWYVALRNSETDLIDNSYLKNLYRSGEKSFFESAGEYFTGTIVGVDLSGNLLIVKDSGEQFSFGFREVSFTS